MDLSIVIVSWNTRVLLRDCLASIYSNPPGCDFEVIVVDNASRDDSARMLRDHFSQVNIIENHENIGFAWANNQGIERCKGRYILLLNPDTKVYPDALDVLVQALDENSNLGGVGPRLINPDGTLQFSCSPAPTLSREALRMLHLPGIRPDGYYPMGDWSLDQMREVDILLGACLLLRREALDQVGLLDEDFFMYSEEVDLCFRLAKRGWRLCWIPQASVIHLGGQSTQQVAPLMFLHLYESKVKFFRKHYGSLASILYKTLLGLAAFSRQLLIFRAFFERSPSREKHLASATNYRKLIYALPGM